MNNKNWLVIGVVVLVALGVWFYFDNSENVDLSPFNELSSCYTSQGFICQGDTVCDCQFLEPPEGTASVTPGNCPAVSPIGQICTEQIVGAKLGWQNWATKMAELDANCESSMTFSYEYSNSGTCVTVTATCCETLVQKR
jgi:hypothetical protein